MNNLNEKLKQAVHKHIKGCGECEGDGETYSILNSKAYKPNLEKEYYDTCKTCSGRGYLLELEVGCEVIIMHNDGFKRNITLSDGQPFYDLGREINTVDETDHYPTDTKHKIDENLGKPLERGDVILALAKKRIQYGDENVGLGNNGVSFDVTFIGELLIVTAKGANPEVNSTNWFVRIPLDLQPKDYTDELKAKLIEILQ